MRNSFGVSYGAIYVFVLAKRREPSAERSDYPDDGQDGRRELRNLDFTLRGGGTRRAASRPVPECEAWYPENRMFGTMLPAYGFYVRHADNIRFENVRLRYKDAEERPPLVQDDATGVVIERCDFQDGKQIGTVSTTPSKISML